MDIKMTKLVELNPLDIVLKVVTLAFFAGGMWIMVNTNTDNINLMRTELKSAIESQAKSSNGLSESIIDLNISVAKLTNSLEFRDRDVEELKDEVRDIRSRLSIVEKVH